VLFPTNLSLATTPGFNRRYDVTADGDRFLMSVPGGGPDSNPITVVVNWLAALKK
jgi:hypothetical protein